MKSLLAALGDSYDGCGDEACAGGDSEIELIARGWAAIGSVGQRPERFVNLDDGVNASIREDWFVIPQFDQSNVDQILQVILIDGRPLQPIASDIP
jgi:hypothetical protein